METVSNNLDDVDIDGAYDNVYKCNHSIRGLKFDKDKLRWDLLPIDMIEKVVEVLTLGSVKYGDNNWQLVANGNERYYAAIMRHLVEWRKGNRLDNESGIDHMAHVICNAIFLMYFDDKKYSKSE